MSSSRLGRFRLAVLLLACASSGCATSERFEAVEVASVGSPAAGAVIPGFSIIEGAAVGAAVGGLAGAVWADRDNDGYVDGYVYNGQYYAGTPAAAAPIGPPRDGPPRYGEREDSYESAPPPMANGGHDERPLPTIGDPERPRLIASRASYRGYRATASMFAADSGLEDVRAWTTANGTLTPSALAAIVDECLAMWGELNSDCDAAVRQGAGSFRLVPEEARNEFAVLFQQGCSADRPTADCRARMEVNRRFRSLPRGRLEPRPMKMDEGKRTRFTVLILDRGQLRGTSGGATDLAVDTSVPAASRQPVVVIPYSARMCFSLDPEDGSKARIEQDQRPGRTVDHGKVCMDVAEGGGSVRYDPSWWVTPLTGDDLRLFLNAEHFIDGEPRDFPYEPRPLVVDVIPKPSLWDRIDAAIRRATATVNLAIGLAEALGGLFAAIAAWGIWSWRKKIGSWLKSWRSGGAPPAP